jgi:hypothetical protein
VGLAVEVVEEIGPEIFEPFGGIDEGLLEPIAPEVDMTDDLPFVGFEGRFTFGIQGCGYGRRIGPALADGIEEKLENIVALPTVEAARAVFDLTGNTKMQATAANNCRDPYPPIPHQPLVHQNV